MLSDMGMMINRRRICGGKSLPYDAEIEYLESSGTQWIDTGIMNDTNVKMNFKVKPSSAVGTYFMGVDNGIVFGTNNGVNFRANGVSSRNAFDTNTFYTIEMYYNGIQRFCVICGSETLSNAVSKMLYETIFLFAASGTGSNTARYYLPWSISECKMWNNNTLVRDFIPVRKGTIGYLYDKVSKQLFGNAGTGSFILGPDKGAVTSPVIDMGLPSGTLWAQGNIVKDANGNYAIGEPTDYGCYFSWGNIDGHNEGDGYSFNSANYALTPGNKLKGDIPSDDAEHDAAVARIGGGFHLPSGNQMKELFNSEYTTNEWTMLNGVNGRRVTSLINGNSVFFPTGGYYNSTSLSNRSSAGCCWLSLLYSSSYAHCLYFNSNNLRTYSYYNRYYGLPVRSVLNV